VKTSAGRLARMGNVFLVIETVLALTRGDATVKFDFDKAKAALTTQATNATDPTAKATANAAIAFLDNNQAQLVALGEDAIMQIVNAYLSGNDTQAVTTFYNLNQQAANMVVNSADVAQRQYDFKQRALTAGRFVAQILVAVLAAGVVF
jgi:hypothetical protein